MRAACRWTFLLLALAQAACVHEAARPGVAAVEVSPAMGEGPGTTAAPEAAEWSRLDPWQGALTAAQWRVALDDRYAPRGAAAGLIQLTDRALATPYQAVSKNPVYTLRNRDPATPASAPPAGARYWRGRAELGPARPGKPLAGLRVALDPGHLGGAWGAMEERSFSINGGPPVQEGDLTLRVAQLLQPRLEALGANVTLVRDRPGPVSTETPASLRPAAEAAYLATFAANPAAAPPPGDPVREKAITQRAEMLFYRVSEIEARARRVNDVLRPDLVLCLHFNGLAWPNPSHPALLAVPQPFHVLVNGAYARAEVENDAQREAMIERIASGAGDEELAAARALAAGAAPVFALVPATYGGDNAVRMSADGYVWARNLEANRLYRCPVVYFEPYLMNSFEGYARIQAGEYAGTRVFGGQARKNIFAEYTDAVVAGLVKYYGERPAVVGK